METSSPLRSVPTLILQPAMDARITAEAKDPPSDSSYPPTSEAGGETFATEAKTKGRKGRKKRVRTLLVAVNGRKIIKEKGNEEEERKKNKF